MDSVQGVDRDADRYEMERVDGREMAERIALKSKWNGKMKMGSAPRASRKQKSREFISSKTMLREKKQSRNGRDGIGMAVIMDGAESERSPNIGGNISATSPLRDRGDGDVE